MNEACATEGLSIDIWNEPDLSYFWTRGQDQYLQMWGRTYHRLRSVFTQSSIGLLLAESSTEKLGLMSN
jgi:hypothetical protein